jgi:hypothetical protein
MRPAPSQVEKPDLKRFQVSIEADEGKAGRATFLRRMSFWVHIFPKLPIFPLPP